MARHKLNYSSSVLTILAITGILLLLGTNLQVTAQEQQQCDVASGLAVLIACERFTRKDGPQIPPDGTCCKAITGIGTDCACQAVTKDVEKIMSLDRFVNVAKSCGRPIPPGTQCGSYKVPPARK